MFCNRVHPYMIQYYPDFWRGSPARDYHLTIDLRNSVMVLGNTVSNQTNLVYYRIDQKSEEYLLRKITKQSIEEFASLPEDELQKRQYAYRDGWSCRYVYFMDGCPPVYGSLSRLYRDNPLEIGLKWAAGFWPDSVVSDVFYAMILPW